MLLGYTLNGYYLIKKGNLRKNKNVGVVYCQFQQPQVQKKGKKINILKSILKLTNNYYNSENLAIIRVTPLCFQSLHCSLQYYL